MKSKLTVLVLVLVVLAIAAFAQWPPAGPSGLPGVRTDGAGGLSVTNKVTAKLHGTPVGSNIASAGTIAPTNGVFHVTGTAAIATITAPTGFTGCIAMIPDGAFTTTTAGNIALASTGVVNKVLFECYDSGTSKWYPSY